MSVNVKNAAQAAELDLSPYCCCSEASFNEILARQRAAPLPFMDLIMVHAGCGSGCGSCLEELEKFLKENGAYIED